MSSVIMNKPERLAHWKTIAAEALRAAGRDDGGALSDSVVWRDEDDLFAFFDCFRPDGAGVERVFAGVVGGEEIVARLLKVYQCTKESFNAWGYFIVRHPARASRDRLIDWTRQHLDKVRQIARSFGSDELVSLLEIPPEIEILQEAAPVRLQPDYDAPEALIYDVVGDWFQALRPVESDALLMEEAFYSIACDYYLAHYLMWPLYKDSTAIAEPYAPYFELWRHGAHAIFSEPELVTVYLAGDT